ncbi:uncharacterized protein [Leuresthes tenuis]|uniref:uncharacterized protein n=1 Tax=Leuresthes tenuis TaxID=355514 RepID=UPI003B500094
MDLSGRDLLEIKGPAVPRYREYSEESADKRLTDGTAPPSQGEKRPIRRVRSPSRPRAWLANSYKPRPGGAFSKLHFPKDDRCFYKPGLSNQRYQHLKPRAYMHHRDYPPLKPHHIALRERQREKEKEKERQREKEKERQRENFDGSSPPKQNPSRPAVSRSTSSRDKDMQFTVCQSVRTQSRERDHRATNSKDRERSRDGELPLTGSQTAARDRAIQQKRREIDEVYYQECEMFGLVAKMLIAKDPSLEHPIQSSLQENLRDIGKRCVEAMEKFIVEYDSRELLH